MTTVLYAGGCLFADSRLSMHEERLFAGKFPKLFERKGRWFAVLGSVAMAVVFVDTLVDCELGTVPDMELDKDTSIVELTQDSRLRIYEKGGQFELEPDSEVGYGTGGSLALAAYMGGAPPMEAMRIASVLDAGGTGGPFHGVRYDKVKGEFIKWSMP